MMIWCQNHRSREETEFELLDTDSFKDNAYFDCFIEYAKAGIDDILMKVTVVNRGKDTAEIHVLPHLWFRNFGNTTTGIHVLVWNLFQTSFQK
jgi:hypothetical protein